MKRTIYIIIFLLFAVSSFSQSVGTPYIFINSKMSDVFNSETVTIGTQVWTLYNLNVAKYRNGDPIPQITDVAQWEAATYGAWCYYNNDPANEAVYGKLYNHYALKDPRGLAPVGFRVPVIADFQALETYLGGAAGAGKKMKIAGDTYFTGSGNTGTNTSGFRALPGGLRHGVASLSYAGIGVIGVFGMYNPDNYYRYRVINRNRDDLYMDGQGYSETNGYYIRLIKE
jgi:uncharacterized protein (TIGR02145 family)